MAEFDIQASIEAMNYKLDNVIKDHEGRISSTEAQVADIKEDLHDEEVKSWIKMGGTYVAVMLSHLGLSKFGFKI